MRFQFPAFRLSKNLTNEHWHAAGTVDNRQYKMLDANLCSITIVQCMKTIHRIRPRHLQRSNMHARMDRGEAMHCEVQQHALHAVYL
jgi:hypothetical protein